MEEEGGSIVIKITFSIISLGGFLGLIMNYRRNVIIIRKCWRSIVRGWKAFVRWFNKYLNIFLWYRKVKYYESYIEKYNKNLMKHARAACLYNAFKMMVKDGADFKEEDLKYLWFDEDRLMKKEIEYQGKIYKRPPEWDLIYNYIGQFRTYEDNKISEEMLKKALDEIDKEKSIDEDTPISDILDEYHKNILMNNKKLIRARISPWKRFKEKVKEPWREEID